MTTAHHEHPAGGFACPVRTQKTRHYWTALLTNVHCPPPGHPGHLPSRMHPPTVLSPRRHRLSRDSVGAPQLATSEHFGQRLWHHSR